MDSARNRWRRIIVIPCRKAARNNTKTLIPSPFVPSIDEDECTACGSCIDICPVKALKLEDDVAKVDAKTCIGCGVCVTHCDPKAIKLVRRTGQVAVADEVKSHIDKL